MNLQIDFYFVFICVPIHTHTHMCMIITEGCITEVPFFLFILSFFFFSNLLRPAGVQLQPATFTLKLYRAEDIPRSM